MQEPNFGEERRIERRLGDRRRRRDPLLKLISVFGVVSWVLMLPALLLVDRARPEVETFFDRWLGLKVDPNWDLEVFRYAFFLMIFILLISGLGLVFNALRNKRKEDSFRINLIVIFGLSLIGVFYYLGRLGAIQ
ncbi:hypothetical protein [Marinospirillum perlucidum]|uniref:hypothetical protein n=1 Tax=Marinospirillum perlucidum TaxID=1982602 RepID=UPI000DF40F3F|nr:hypothetical protein [Marinospirillum perlucidum]